MFGSQLALKYEICVEVSDIGKHCNLLRYGKIYFQKSFIVHAPGLRRQLDLIGKVQEGETDCSVSVDDKAQTNFWNKEKPILAHLLN